MDIHWIRKSVEIGDYDITAHADQEMQIDEVSIYDLEKSLLEGEVLEDYPNDPRGQSCLVLGYTERGLPLHIVCGMTTKKNLRIITVYVPILPRWISPRERRKL